MQEWAILLIENRKLIIDIIHPRRELAALYIGPGEVSLGGGPAVWYECIQICENTTFDECRQYAQSLAYSADLVITNSMPAQLPAQIEDGIPAFNSWVNYTRVSPGGTLLLPPWLRNGFSGMLQRKGFQV